MIIDNLLSGINKMAVSGHIHPDGDCLGSVLGIYDYVRKNYPDIEIDMFLERPGDGLSFLKNVDKIKHEPCENVSYDLMICVDCASLERLGMARTIFENAAHTVNIDHHISNTEYAGINHVHGGASSCCEVLYGLMDKNKLDADIATALYVGIVTDTGVFKYEATSPNTMRVAADLMEFNIPTNKLIDDCFYLKSFAENRIMGYALAKSKLYCEGRIIASTLTIDEMNDYGATNKDLDGIVSQLKLTKGSELAVFMYETSSNEFKLSLRTGPTIDANTIAMKFGGGGHIRAAGASLHGELNECFEAVMKEAKEAIM